MPLREQSNRLPRPRRLSDPAAALYARRVPQFCKSSAAFPQARKDRFAILSAAACAPRKNGSQPRRAAGRFRSLPYSCGTSRRGLRICPPQTKIFCMNAPRYATAIIAPLIRQTVCRRNVPLRCRLRSAQKRIAAPPRRRWFSFVATRLRHEPPSKPKCRAPFPRERARTAYAITHSHALRRYVPVFRLYFTIYGGKSKPLFSKRRAFKQILICAACTAPASAALDLRQNAKVATKRSRSRGSAVVMQILLCTAFAARRVRRAT